MKIIAIITGNRKARIINMRTANYDKYKIIFIDSCTVQVLFDQHPPRWARVIITTITTIVRSVFRSFLDTFIIHFISSQDFRIDRSETTSTFIFFPFFFSRRVERERERESRSSLDPLGNGARRESGSRATSRQFFGQCLDEGSNSPRT